MREKERCPNCNSDQVVSIVYGYPSRELVEEADRRKIMLGGCEPAPNKPRFHCNACGSEWGAPGEIHPLLKIIAKVIARISQFIDRFK